MNVKKLKNNFNTLVFGCSGSIGIEISKNLNRKNTLLISRKKPKNLTNYKWEKIDLNKKKINIPKKVDKIFFLSSPYYIKKNFSFKKFNQEYIWLKKIVRQTKFNKIIYFSSRSVYLKNHPLGKIKLKCENYLIKKKIKFLQIWRPFNILGKYENVLSDHFHNILLKEFFFKKKIKHTFAGNINDRRSYSSAKKFSKVVVDYSKQNKSFIINYKNSKSITIKKILNIFIKILKKRDNREIKYYFKSKFLDNNKIKNHDKIKYLDSKENSAMVMKKYFLNQINENK